MREIPPCAKEVGSSADANTAAVNILSITFSSS
jgi:hypothetical protein